VLPTGAVEHRVADHHALIRLVGGAFRRAHDDAAAGQALADIVVGVADKIERHAARQEGAEGLAGGAGQADGDRVVGEAFMVVATGHLAGEHRAGGAVDVADRRFDGDGLAVLQGGLRLGDQLAVEDVVDRMLLRPRVAHLLRRGVGLVEDAREIEAARLPVVDQPLLVEPFGLADQLVELAHAHLRHDAAGFLRQQEEEVDGVLRRADEALPEHRVLRGDADGAGVQMALAHHDAADGDQRRGGEAELVGAEQGADDDVAAGLQAAVDLQRDARAQALFHQDLLRLGEADLPRRAGMLDGGEGAGARAAVIAGDGDMVGARLGDAGGDRADADFGHELHRHPAFRVDVLQVEDELGDVLDGIDVMMRRRRDQADARRRVTHLGDHRVDLVAGQLAAFAGLGALGDLDLHHVGVDEVFRRHAEAARRHLLDGRAL